MKKIIIALITVLASLSFVHAQSYDWAIASQGKIADTGNAVCMDAEGNSYVTGSFSSSAFAIGGFSLTNTTITSTNPYDAFDMFVAKIDKTGKVVWAIQSNGAGEERGIDIACDKTGHIAVVGIFKGAKATFGTTELANLNTSSFSSFIMRINALGKVQWVQWADGKSSAEVYSVSCGPNGEIYITGSFAHGVTFGGYEYKSKSGNNSSVFVAKYLSDGTLKWFEQIHGKGYGGQNSTQVGKAIFATDDSKFVYVAGWFRGRVTFGNEEITSNDFFTDPRSNIFITKYDSDGNTLWTRSIGRKQVYFSGDPEVTDIAVDAQENSYVTGHFPGILIFGNEEMKGVLSRGKSWNRDIFLAKYDSEGNHLWHRSAGGSDNDESHSIALTPNGVTITGTVSWGDVKFGDVQMAPGFPNLFVANYNADGKCLWAIGAKAVVSSIGKGIATDGTNTIVTGQYLANGITFGKISLKGIGSGNFFAAKIK